MSSAIELAAAQGLVPSPPSAESAAAATADVTPAAGALPATATATATATAATAGAAPIAAAADALFTRAIGSVLIDAGGRRCIDFFSAGGVLNYGHNDPDLCEALVQHIRQRGLAGTPGWPSAVWQRFEDRFTRHILQPRGLPHQLLMPGPTAADALAAAVRLARQHTGRQRVVAFTQAGHGQPLTGRGWCPPAAARSGLPADGVQRLAYDGYLGPAQDTAAHLAQWLADPASGLEPPAAIVLEAVQVAGGLNSAGPAWLARVATLARRHGALLVLDDSVAGCGRSGRFFSFEGLGLAPALLPDLVLLGPSLSGFGLPLALLLARPDCLANLDRVGPGPTGATGEGGRLTGADHALVTATAAIDKFWRGGHFLAKVDRRAQLVARALQQLVQDLPGVRARGRGMLQGLDMGSGARAARVQQRCLAAGLVVGVCGASGQVVPVLAPLTTPKLLLEQGLDRLQTAVRQVVAECGLPVLTETL